MIHQSEIDIYSMMAYNVVSPEYSKKQPLPRWHDFNRHAPFLNAILFIVSNDGQAPT